MITLEELLKRDKEAKKKEKEKNRLKRVANQLALEDPDSIDTTTTKEDEKTSRLQEEISEEVKSGKLDSWKPFELKDFVLPEFNIPVKKSNYYESFKKEMLSQILTFIDFTKRKRCKTGCTIMPIPTTSRQNLMIWGYPMAISRAISFMKEIGLISEYIGIYRFGVPYEDGNYGKLYAYYKDNEDKILQYCKELDIHKAIIKNVEEISTEKQLQKINTINEVKSFEINNVRFGKNLGLKKPKGVSNADFEMYLTQCLYNNYPEFKFHQSKVDEINENFYEAYPEFKLRFKPHFTWKNGAVSKIGIRLSNEYCNKEKEERLELLSQYGFHLEKDVRSSVPRLTLSINTGRWIDEDIDIYKIINDEFEPGSKFTVERRNALKHYILTAYFEEGSKELLGKNVTYKIDKTGIIKDEVDDLMDRLRQATIKAVGGKTYGSEIFYIESCVYLMTVYDLLTSGHMTWLVYDAFYSNGEEDQETFEKMLRHGIKMNFQWFLEKSNFGHYTKDTAAIEENENRKPLSVFDIAKKYDKKTFGVKN